MSELAIPGTLRRVDSRVVFRDRWGLLITLALVAAALTSVIVGLDLASLLILILGLMAAVYGLRDPAIGLIGIGVLATVEPLWRTVLTSNSTELPVRIPYNTVNYWLVLFCLVNVKRVFQLRYLQTKIHLLLLAVLVVGLFWTPTLFPQGIQEVFRLAAGFSLILYFTALPPSQHRALYWVALSASSVATIFGLFMFHDVEVASRINANNLAMMPQTGLFAVFLAVFAKVAKGREMHVLMLLGAANLTFAFLSGSRGAIVTSLFVWLVILLWGVDLPRKMAYGAAGVLVMMGLAALSPDFQEYAVKRLEFTFDSSRTIAQRSSGRTELAMIGWRLFLENPAGLGTGAFDAAMTHFYDRDVRFWAKSKTAHSAWVQVLAENGVLGIVMLLAYVCSFAWTGLSRGRHGRGAHLLIGLVASTGLAVRFVSTEFGDLGVWWFAAGCIFLLHRRARPPRRILYSLRATPGESPADTVPSTQSRWMPGQISTPPARRRQA